MDHDTLVIPSKARHIGSRLYGRSRSRRQTPRSLAVLGMTGRSGIQTVKLV